MLYWIKDTHRNAFMNMAIDEVLFNHYDDASVIRTYYWDKPFTSIGYFQKSKEVAAGSFVRRFTGGLTVNHHHDTSYCFVTSSKYWNVYDYNKTYMIIHLALKRALENCGIYTSMLGRKTSTVSNICIDTFCINDLLLNGKKIAGSCLRRRGSKLIVEGSMHILLKNRYKDLFTDLFAKNLAAAVGGGLKEIKLDEIVIKKALTVASEKYSNPYWNNKY
jgi:lipoate-protein ligase A